jgi:hypothetical protein
VAERLDAPAIEELFAEADAPAVDFTATETRAEKRIRRIEERERRWPGYKANLAASRARFAAREQERMAAEPQLERDLIESLEALLGCDLLHATAEQLRGIAALRPLTPAEARDERDAAIRAQMAHNARTVVGGEHLIGAGEQIVRQYREQDAKDDKAGE